MIPFWCNSYWICKPTLSTIALSSNNTEIVIENWQDEDEGELPNHREEDVFAQDDSSRDERDEVETTLVSYLGIKVEL